MGIWKRLFAKKDPGSTSAVGREPTVPPHCHPIGDQQSKAWEPGFVILHEVTGLELLWVPGTDELTGRSMREGYFMMGSTPKEIENQWKENGWTWEAATEIEQPKHPVKLSPFWIARTEVTNEHFARFAEKTGYKAEGGWLNYFLEEHPNHPAVCVSRNDAKAFCRWAGLELPTEAQWEWAARGSDGSIYPWGDKWNSRWCNNLELHAGPLPTPEDFDDYIRRLNREAEDSPLDSCMFDIHLTARCLCPVGAFPQDKSWCGAMDMAGSVQEWCFDFFDGDYYKQSNDRDPEGPKKEEGPYQSYDYAIRGGCWSKIADFCRLASRGMDIPKNTHHARGFRPCLRTA